MNAATWFAAALFTIGVVLFLGYFRTGKPLRCMLFTALTGSGAMGAVLLAGNFFAIGLAPTPFSLLVSVILGIPGVVGMLLLRLI